VYHLSFFTDTDGRRIENPKFYEKSLTRIRIEHTKLSRKKKDSKNWEKQKIKLAIARGNSRNAKLSLYPVFSSFKKKPFHLPFSVKTIRY